MQTWQLLKDRSDIILPGDYRELVEGVYGKDIHLTGDKLVAARAKYNPGRK